MYFKKSSVKFPAKQTCCESSTDKTKRGYTQRLNKGKQRERSALRMLVVTVLIRKSSFIRQQ